MDFRTRVRLTIAIWALVFAGALCLSQAQLLMTGAGKGTPSTLAPVTLTNAAATLTLSGGNLTATATSTAGNGANARSTTSHASGQYYFEGTLPASSGIGGLGLSLFNASEPNTNYSGQTNNSLGVYPFATVVVAVYINGAPVVTLGTHSMFPQTIGVSVNISAKRAYFTWDGTNWYGDTANTTNADPVAGTHGLDISAITGALLAGVEVDNSGESATINFGATSYAFTSPSGSVNW